MRLAALLLLTTATAGGAQTACRSSTIPAYSHNDYRNVRPLVTPLELGFRGVEADLFLVDGELRVGHDRKAARRAPRFEDVYLRPLQTAELPCGQPFLLTVELKEESQGAFDSLVALLGRVSLDSTRVMVVLVGWHPPVSNWSGATVSLGAQYRINGTDERRLERDIAALDPRVRLISLDYGKTIGRWWNTPSRSRRWLAAIRKVKALAPGRVIRVHNVPVDLAIYATLLEAGVDLIGSTDLQATRRILR